MFGFYLLDEFVRQEEFSLSEGSFRSNFSDFKRYLLSLDLRKQPRLKPFFYPTILSSQDVEQQDSPAVVQVVSVSNVALLSRQKSEDHASRRLLAIVLTDGHTNVTAVEATRIPGLTASAAPGSKLLVKVGGRCGASCC
ncbi:hypothetical protein EON64_10430, partial [archaeon]